jgi:hypothetical protein
MNRLLAIAFILFCFEIGLFLIFVPWSQLWENNVLLGYSFYLRRLLLNNFFRGAVSGLGVIDLILGFSELGRFWKSLGLVNRSTTKE